jgi:chemotaxis protein methyltransferase CheR
MHPISADIGDFDVIFLRNVMIYFDQETKTKVVQHLLPRLRSGGYLMIGHSETLSGIVDGLMPVRPTIYRKA